MQARLQIIAEQGDHGSAAVGLHLCIVNLVIGTLYCTKGNFDFGVRLIVKSLTPVSEKLGTDTWYYSKRCLLALIEKIVKRQYELHESLYAHIIIFLDEAYQVGKNITSVLFPTTHQQQTQSLVDNAATFSDERSALIESQIKFDKNVW